MNIFTRQDTLSLLHREGGASTLMETELQDRGLAVYPRIKVLFQPTDRTHPNVLSEVPSTLKVFSFAGRSLSPCVDAVVSSGGADAATAVRCAPEGEGSWHEQWRTGAQKMADVTEKSLTLRAGLPTILVSMAVPGT